MTEKTLTLTVCADEVQVGDRIDWLGTVATSKRFAIRNLWCINTGTSASDPRTYLHPDALITVTRTVVDPDADLIEAMTKAEYEAWGNPWEPWEEEEEQERHRDAMRAALAALRAYDATTAPVLPTPHADDTPEAIIETLAGAQLYTPGEEHVDRLGRLIDAYQQLRPVGSDGKHGDRHAEHCGCTGKGPRVVTTVDGLDALPEGTILSDRDGEAWQKVGGGGWWHNALGLTNLAHYLPVTVLREGWGQ